MLVVSLTGWPPYLFVYGLVIDKAQSHSSFCLLCHVFCLIVFVRRNSKLIIIPFSSNLISSLDYSISHWGVFQYEIVRYDRTAVEASTKCCLVISFPAT